MHRRPRNLVKLLGNCTFLSTANYKTELFSLRWFGQPQGLDLPGGLQENLTVVIIPGKLQHIPTSVLGQFSRQYQKLVANCFYSGSRIIVRQAQPLKPMDEVVRQKQQLQEGYVGHPTLRRNFIQGKILEEFPNRLFHVGSRLVGLPNHPGLQLQVGHKSRVGEPAHLQQAQLLRLLGVFRQRSPHHDEPVLRFPSARLKTKLCHRPAKGHFLEASLLGQGQVELGLGANNNIAAACLVQITHQLSRKESRVGQQTNPGSCHRRRNFFHTAPDQSASPRVGSRVAGPQRPVPKLLAVSFKAQQRMIGRASFHPLLCFEAHGQEFWHGSLRPGDAAANTGARALVRRCMEKVPSRVARSRIRLLADSGFFSGKLVSDLDQAGCRYIVVCPKAKLYLPLAQKAGFQEMSFGWAVAEFRFQPRRWEAEHRFIMVRRPLPEDPEEAQTLSPLKAGRFAYSAFVTNLELQPWMILKTYQARANVEKSVRELLQYFSLNKIPTQSWVANVAFLQLLLLAYNLVHWFKRLCLPDDYARATVETICNEFLVLPAKLAKHGSRNVLQLPRDYNHREIFLKAARRIEALRLPEPPQGEKFGFVSSR